MVSISVVTICKDARSTIERSLRSVCAASTDVQYVVVDGGSTDGTLQIIERYRDRIDVLVSEPDAGISDALNKAISLTTADYHLVLHADDVLCPDSLSSLRDAATSSAAPVICGSVRVMRGDKLVRVFRPQPARLLQKMSVPHMGALMAKRVWREVGGYDLRRRIAMDHLIMLKILDRYGIGAFVVIDCEVAQYHLGGLSDAHIVAGFREVRDNLIEHGQGAWAANAAFATLMAKATLARAIGRA